MIPNFYNAVWLLIFLKNLADVETVATQNEDPAIKVYSTNLKPPQVVTVARRWENSRGFNFLENQGNILLVCFAPYPITWKLTSLLSLTRLVKFLQPLRVLSKSLFLNSVILDCEKEYVLNLIQIALHVTCEKIDDARIKSEFFIFARNNISSALIQPETSTVTDSSIIPCPTIDPTTDVQLFLTTPWGEDIPVLTSTYDPTMGFVSEQIYKGNFTCRQGSSSVSISAVTTQPFTSNEFVFSPKPSSVRAFTKDFIDLECLSKSVQPIKINFDESAKAFIKSSNHTSVSGNKVELTFQPLNQEESLKGKARCIFNITENDFTTVKEWTFEFVPFPKLYLDNNESTITCDSAVAKISLEVIHCRHSLDCSFLASQCGHNMSRCREQTGRSSFVSSNLNSCKDIPNNNGSCVRFPYSSLTLYNIHSGLAQCVLDGVVTRIMFFESLTGRKYVNWKDAPNNELVRVGHDLPSILHTNKSTKFVCEAVGYLFAVGMAFDLEFRNGSRQRIADIEELAIRDIPGLHVVSYVNLELAGDEIGVHCLALWWNSTDVMVSSKYFEARNMIEPHFVGDGDNYGRNMEKVAYKGRQTFRLKCYAMGEPKPEYTWYVRNRLATFVFPELQTGLDLNGESYLEFPNVNFNERKIYSGIYECHARNEAGSVEKRYLVDVPDEPNDGNLKAIPSFLLLSTIGACLYLNRFLFYSTNE